MSADTAQPTIFAAMAAAMEEVQTVKKTGHNSSQGYNFRGIDAVVNAVGPVFRKHGIVPVPTRSEAVYRDVQTSTGKPSRECTVTVTYRFYGPLGDFIEAQVPGESMDFGDKGAPKAMSVAYRILLLQALCIPTDDPEPDSQSYERAPAPAKQTPDQIEIAEWADKIREIAPKAGIYGGDPAIAKDYANRNPGKTIGAAGVDDLKAHYAELEAEIAHAAQPEQTSLSVEDTAAEVARARAGAQA
jgi:hypothetical protein